MVTVACLCPPNAAGEVRHPAGDEITLREHLDFRGSLAARKAFISVKAEDAGASSADILAVMTETYLLYGIESWTLEDAKGAPVPVTKTTIRETLMSRVDRALDVADAADALYSEEVLLPLMATASASSPPTPTAESTSATTPSLSESPTPSKQSSITTIPTAVTASPSRSPDGGSSFSQNSA